MRNQVGRFQVLFVFISDVGKDGQFSDLLRCRFASGRFRVNHTVTAICYRPKGDGNVVDERKPQHLQFTHLYFAIRVRAHGAFDSPHNHISVRMPAQEPVYYGHQFVYLSSAIRSRFGRGSVCTRSSLLTVRCSTRKLAPRTAKKDERNGQERFAHEKSAAVGRSQCWRVGKITFGLVT